MSRKLKVSDKTIQREFTAIRKLGINIMFTNCIKEGKPLPDYSYSDDYQVDLRFYGEIPDDAFYLFVQGISHIQTVYYVIRRNGEASMSDFVTAFDGTLTQKQVRNLIEGLCKTPLISSQGNARATRYHWV